MSPSKEFTGPWSKSLPDFLKVLQSMPSQSKASFEALSTEALTTICNASYLHVWETDSDIDNLLQLTQAIVKIRNKSTGILPQKDVSPGMVIRTELKAGRDNFARLCDLVKHLVGDEGKPHLEGTVRAFGTIVVVKGVNYMPRPGKGEVESTVKRIDVAIERVFKKGGYKEASKKVVWHHGPVVHFLLDWIDHTTNDLRSRLAAVTITAALDLSSPTAIKPSPQGRANTVPDLNRLEDYCKRLSICAVFLDVHSQLITYQYLTTYMYFYGYYINTFLPASVSHPHLHMGQDQLTEFAFRLLGAAKNKYEGSAVSLVQSKFEASKARIWAKQCITASNYTKEKCRAAAQDAQIHHAVQLADSPFTPFTPGLDAFARLAVGPAASLPPQSHHMAAPVQIAFNNSSLRVNGTSPFRLLLPTSGQDLEKVTARIQGMMMGVLELVRREKGMPVLGDAEKDMWGAVVKACSFALGECKGGLPKGVEEKVGFVRARMTEGTWGYALAGRK